MKKLKFVFMGLALLGLVSCGGKTPTPDISVTGKVTEIEKYGHALLDIETENFSDSGFCLGDVVTVSVGNYTGDMPYFNGYYVDRNEYMLRAYPGHKNIAICINYGNFCEVEGVNVGDEVTIKLKERGGQLSLQEVSTLEYSLRETDYASKEIFANFRPITGGSIGNNVIYRSASPVDNEFNRASVANKLAEEAGIKTVMNMGNTSGEIASILASSRKESEYYAGLYDSGNVIGLGMSIDFASEAFGMSLVQGFSFLIERQPPYLIHCTEGKDRAGFASMILAALMGASLKEIQNDYMTSYINYYSLDPRKDKKKYNLILEKNLMEMLYVVTGSEKGSDLSDVDLSKAAADYLIAHGMHESRVDALKNILK